MKKNKIVLLLELLLHFLKSIFLSIILFLKHIFWNKKVSPLPENRFLDSMNFLFHIWPKSFWKKPTWIKIGRSPATFIYYIFEKENRFEEKK